MKKSYSRKFCGKLFSEFIIKDKCQLKYIEHEAKHLNLDKQFIKIIQSCINEIYFDYRIFCLIDIFNVCIQIKNYNVF